MGLDDKDNNEGDGYSEESEESEEEEETAAAALDGGRGGGGGVVRVAGRRLVRVRSGGHLGKVLRLSKIW